MKEKIITQSCQYYTYILYGEAMIDGSLDNKEKVFKVTRLRKSTRNFWACFDLYRGTRAGGWTISNIGPYDTESVIYSELNRQRNQLVNQGFIEWDIRIHSQIFINLLGYEKC